MKGLFLFPTIYYYSCQLLEIYALLRCLLMVSTFSGYFQKRDLLGLYLPVLLRLVRFCIIIWDVYVDNGMLHRLINIRHHDLDQALADLRVNGGADDEGVIFEGHDEDREGGGGDGDDIYIYMVYATTITVTDG